MTRRNAGNRKKNKLHLDSELLESINRSHEKGSQQHLQALIRNALVVLSSRKGSTPPEIRACIMQSKSFKLKKFPTKLKKVLQKGFVGLVRVPSLNSNRGQAFNFKRTRFKLKQSTPVSEAAATTDKDTSGTASHIYIDREGDRNSLAEEAERDGPVLGDLRAQIEAVKAAFAR